MRATHRQRLELHRLGRLLARAFPEALGYTSDILADDDVSAEVVEREVGKMRRRCIRHHIPVEGLVEDKYDPMLFGDRFPPPPKGGYTY